MAAPCVPMAAPADARACRARPHKHVTNLYLAAAAEGADNMRFRLFN